MPSQTVLPYSLDRAVELVLASIQERVQQNSAAPVFVGVSGIDCSGKTTLAKALFASLHGVETSVELVSVDDYIIPRAMRRYQPVAHINYFENTFDHAALSRRIAELRHEADIDLVIAEGVFLFREELVDNWNLKVWLEMGTEHSVRRGSARDAGYFGSVNNARFEYERRFVPAHEYHLERDKPQEAADFVFNVD